MAPGYLCQSFSSCLLKACQVYCFLQMDFLHSLFPNIWIQVCVGFSNEIGHTLGLAVCSPYLLRPCPPHLITMMPAHSQHDSNVRLSPQRETGSSATECGVGSLVSKDSERNDPLHPDPPLPESSEPPERPSC